MRPDTKKITLLFMRYIFVGLLGLGNLAFFYWFLTPLTVTVVSGFVSLFTFTIVRGTEIIFSGVVVSLVPACIMGSAFYLLFILIFTTPSIRPLLRLRIIVVSSGILFISNVIRILFLISIRSFNSFESIHWVIWNVVSVLFIVGIWLWVTRRFAIKTIPIYSDMKYLFSLRHSKRKVLRK